MCVIMYGKTKDILSLDLDRAWNQNKDGAGLILPIKNPVTYKGIMSIAELKSILIKLPKQKYIALHLRQATHGPANKGNTHPFEVERNVHLMHNGCLFGLGSSGNKGSSDSAHLARILSKVSHKDRVALLQALPGKYLVSNHGKITLIGGFETVNNVECSNTSWQLPTIGYGSTQGTYGQYSWQNGVYGNRASGNTDNNWDD